MTFVSAVLCKNGISVVSDGKRVNSETGAVNLNVKKFVKINDSLIIAWAGTINDGVIEYISYPRTNDQINNFKLDLIKTFKNCNENPSKNLDETYMFCYVSIDGLKKVEVLSSHYSEYENNTKVYSLESNNQPRFVCIGGGNPGGNEQLSNDCNPYCSNNMDDNIKLQKHVLERVKEISEFVDGETFVDKLLM